MEDWLKFIKSKKREEFMVVAEKSRHITRALEELEMMSGDEATRMVYEYRLKMIRDENARMDDAVERGLEKGRMQGLTQGIEEFYALIKKGYAPEEAKKKLQTAYYNGG
ncbi:MAG: PD-(D/E)XK nuclease family transposase [Chitinispirillales bacterium]|nr:PD-(D/E)XK nuclease family transposase [Chitinispirillales bacterium]